MLFKFWGGEPYVSTVLEGDLNAEGWAILWFEGEDVAMAGKKGEGSSST